MPRNLESLCGRGARAVLLAFAIVVALPCAAAKFPDLYRATVSPDRAEADQRAAALKLAMARVLVRVTGNRDAALDPDLQSLLVDPARYVSSYGVVRQGQAQVGFNANLIDQTLAAMNRPVWGQERPLTLLWIGVDDGVGGRALLSANPTTVNELGNQLPQTTIDLLSAIRTEIAAVADERGLPLTLPLLDIEDLGAVTFADVWGGFDDRITLASARYRPDAILIGRVRPGLTGNEVQWLLLKDGTRRGIDGLALRDGLDSVANLFASELSVVGGATATRLTVLDVATLADYGRVMSYLESLSVLQSVDVDSLERGVLNLRVAARGDARVLERVLALGGVLAPAGATVQGGALTVRIARAGSAR